jgi:centractin
MIKGFGDRLLHEVQRLAVKDMRIKIFAPPERLYSTWIGGSILAGLSTFRKMYVTIDDWHESKSGSSLSVIGSGDNAYDYEFTDWFFRADPDIIHQKFA